MKQKLLVGSIIISYKQILIITDYFHFQVKRGEGFFFVPSTEDINRLIKLVCIPRRGQSQGYPLEVVSRKVVAAGPGFCPFEDRHQVILIFRDDATCQANFGSFFSDGNPK